MLHLPLLRRGRPYRSLDTVRLRDHRSGQEVVEISQANPGLIRRDLLRQEECFQVLASVPAAELLRLCQQAAGHFLNDTLPLGDDGQSPEDYVRQVSATTGLPHVLARRNMAKVHGVLSQMAGVVKGLTRGLDLGVLDRGQGEADGHALSFFPRGHSLGVVLPSNSPGVHSLWVPAVAFKTPLVLKPGSAEPWTPYRIVQALLKVGVPAEAFGYYPTDHAGAAEVLRLCGRGMLFGDVGSLRAWQGDPRIELHGPGYSKVVLGDDAVDLWSRYLDVMVASILDNGGRSCVNASGIWVTRHGAAIAEALAKKLATVQPRDAADDEARLAPSLDADVARRISQTIDRDLREPGAREVTASRRGPRLVEWQGCSYLLPTLILCDRPDHPLANREFLFPFASIVELPEEEIPDRLGPTLALTAITSSRELTGRLLRSPLIQRLNLGPIPTYQVSWDQPHEGNLFDHLWARRALQAALA